MLTNYANTQKFLCNANDNDIIRLAFVGRLKEGNVGKLWFDKIHEDTYSFNHSYNITGFLINGGSSVFQCIEGKKQVLKVVIANIFSDKRYKQVSVVLAEVVNNSSFTDWCIHYSTMNKAFGKPPQLPQTLHQYLPFKPASWPSWYVEYFIKSMTGYKGEKGKYRFANFVKSGNRSVRVSKVNLLVHQPLLSLFIIVGVYVLLFIALIMIRSL